MKNSRSKSERIAAYKDAGWTVIGDTATLTTNNSVKSRHMAPEGEYDKWLPLPENAAVSPHEEQVSRALEINKKIALGARSTGPTGDLPSAWIDYAGLDRNIALYTSAKEEAKKELERAFGTLYVRKGSRFIRV